jgi:hypothetical protein
MKTRPAAPTHDARRRSVDTDGVVRVELRQGAHGRSLGIAIAVITVLLGLGGLLWLRREPSAASQAAVGRSPQGKAQPHDARPRGQSLSPRALVPAPLPPAAQAEAEARAPQSEPEGETDEGPEADTLDDAAEAPRPQVATLGGFPAPGTKRIKPGIIVPEDFPLPPGYVRHYQSTDKGALLQAILMFHPDHQPLDAQGKPIPLPPDRVVPPDMAPPGMPLDTLQIPADAYADRHDAPPAEPSDGDDEQP